MSLTLEMKNASTEIKQWYNVTKLRLILILVCSLADANRLKFAFRYNERKMNSIESLDGISFEATKSYTFTSNRIHGSIIKEYKFKSQNLAKKRNADIYLHRSSRYCCQSVVSLFNRR